MHCSSEQAESHNWFMDRKVRETTTKVMKTAQEETRKGPWTEQEDLQLVYFVSLFGERRWDFIAKVSGSRMEEEYTP